MSADESREDRSWRFERDGFDIVVRRVYDECPDLSYLGKYTDDPKGEKYIDRLERGDWDGGRREYRYFVVGTGDPDCIEEDYERFEAYDRDEWCMVGVLATVFFDGVELDRDSLWGIESDSGKAHFRQVEQDCADTALSQAKVKLAQLCAKAKEVEACTRPDTSST